MAVRFYPAAAAPEAGLGSSSPQPWRPACPLRTGLAALPCPVGIVPLSSPLHPSGCASQYSGRCAHGAASIQAALTSARVTSPAHNAWPAGRAHRQDEHEKETYCFERGPIYVTARLVSASLHHWAPSDRLCTLPRFRGEPRGETQKRPRQPGNRGSRPILRTLMDPRTLNSVPAARWRIAIPNIQHLRIIGPDGTRLSACGTGAGQ